MAIEVERADKEQMEEWDQLVSRATAGSFFHRRAVLEVLEAHSSSIFHPLIGYKGQEPVGLFPLFEVSKGPLKMAFSPPPKLAVPGLGPTLVNADKLKQRKREKRTRRFIEGCLEWIELKIGPKYTRIVTTPGLTDSRPFAWNEFEVTPKYTYHVDLSPGKNEVMDRFKKSLRSDIRRSTNEEHTIERGTVEDVQFVVEKVRERYQAQDREYNVTESYATDLFETLGPESISVYIGRINGERVSGILAPRHKSTIYYWQGGGKPDISLPMNDLIHWQIIKDSIDDGINTYDLVGANTPRLCRYKSKFNPNLKPYYVVERGTKVMNAVSDIYKKFQ